ncbi:MAG: hydroxymethylbilane synthase [Candidatus Neomarinimicrobiota bacterium]
MNKLIIGTRGSRLALWQANYVSKLLKKEHPGLKVTLEIIKTSGDIIQNKALPEIGGKALFTKEIETALLEESVDLGVHSLKDLPSALPDGLKFVCTPEREDPRDAFVSFKWKNFSDLPPGAIIATGSVRRKTQIQNVRQDINFRDLRGNIETRLKKLKKNGWDGIIMAAAALIRMELKSNISEKMDPNLFIPAVGQGAIGLEIKSSRLEVLKILNKINHRPTMLAVSAERKFMQILEGGCSIPLGAWGREAEGKFYFSGFFAGFKKRTLIKTVFGAIDQADSMAEAMALEIKSLNS